MKLEKKSFLREGKAKILHETEDPRYLIQYFKDDATAFNAQKRGSIRDKGVVNNQVSSWVFPFLEKQGIPTHFVEKQSDREMIIRKVEIIPVEVVVRNRAAGSLVKRYGIEKGKVLSEPLLEYFYKSDALGDPLIGETHIFFFKWATPKEMQTIQTLSLKVNEALKKLFSEIGIDLVDFKLEFGRLPTGEVVLADEFAPDVCRLWDKVTGEPMDKDRFRQDLGGVEEAYQEVYRRLEAYFKKESA